MYLGRVMEIAPCGELYENALHPYTQILLSAIPVADPLVEAKRKAVSIGGEVPSIANRPEGCPFHTRCPRASERCRHERRGCATSETGTSWPATNAERAFAPGAARRPFGSMAHRHSQILQGGHSQ